MQQGTSQVSESQVSEFQNSESFEKAKRVATQAERGLLPLTRRRWLLRCGLMPLIGAGVGASLGRMLYGGERQDELITPEAQEAIEQGLSWLSGQTHDDGTVGEGSYSANTGVVGLVGLAFLAQGSLPDRGRWGEPLRRIMELLFSQTQSNGLISSAQAQSRGPMYEHAFATLLLAEVIGSWTHPKLRPTLTRAIEVIVDSQNEEGGWRYQPRRDDADVSVTVAQVMALRAARNAGIFVSDDCVQRAIDYLKRSQNPDGGFRYMGEERESAFPRSAAALVALFNAGISGGVEIDRGINYLLKTPPEPISGLLPSHYFYGHYYAIQAMWHAGEERFARWYPAIRDVLIERQQVDGRWEDLMANQYATAMACIILQVPNNLLPILQR